MGLFTKDKDFYKSFLYLTLMMALQNLITCSVNLADNVMLGGFSEAALSGVALANQIQFVLQMLTMGIGEGIMVLCAQYWGKKDTQAINRILSIGLKIGLAMSFTLWAIVFFFTEGCLGLFTTDAAVIAEGASYLKIVCFSYCCFSMTNICLCSLRSVETVKIGFVISFTTLIINVCLNYTFIYGHFGAPRLGAQGAAIATLTSRIIELIIMAVYLLFIDKKIHFKLRSLLVLDHKLLRDYFKVGTPVIISNTMWGLAMAIQAGILGHLGAQAIAANAVAATVFQLMSVVAYGSASAASVIIGKTIGSGQKLDTIKEYAKTMQVIFLIIGVFAGLGLFAIKDLILTFYSISPEAKTLAIQFITVLAVTIVGTSYQCPALTGIVRGGGDTKFVLINDTIFMWLIVLPLSALAAFVFKLSPVFVFICLKSDQILKCAVAVIKVNRYKWVHILTK